MKLYATIFDCRLPFAPLTRFNWYNMWSQKTMRSAGHSPVGCWNINKSLVIFRKKSSSGIRRIFNLTATSVNGTVEIGEWKSISNLCFHFERFWILGWWSQPVYFRQWSRQCSYRQWCSFSRRHTAWPSWACRVDFYHQHLLVLALADARSRGGKITHFKGFCEHWPLAFVYIINPSTRYDMLDRICSWNSAFGETSERKPWRNQIFTIMSYWNLLQQRICTQLTPFYFY